MGNVVLKVENLSKQYRLGQFGTGTISHDLNRVWARLRGKEDPYLKVGDANDRAKTGGSDYVWSLKDINFSLKQGEVLGIVGKNGAGKSTLLKILSQVTSPTTGSVKVKGRIAALLEVGTGFHPDLSGRENIFLNGTILGMTKDEIRKKLDEIVDFSGVAKYLDTPVKRYSSGMMVRLGFAVAAHLEPEILIVDEVLAVGDAEFQKKCLGKMKRVSGEGRTVLFVSHNMGAVKALCTRGLLLENGSVIASDEINKVLNRYSITQSDGNLDLILKRKGIGEVRLTQVQLETQGSTIKSGSKLIIHLTYKAERVWPGAKYEFVVGIWNSLGSPMFMLTNLYLEKDLNLSSEGGRITFIIDKLALNAGDYSMNFLIAKNGIDLDFLENAFSFTVEDGNYFNSYVFYPNHFEGFYQDFEITDDYKG
jgi:lipopolysaccharide transport system ATP-binding protein